MNDPQFTFVIRGELTDKHRGALAEVACTDTAFPDSSEMIFGELYHQSRNIIDAVGSAVSPIERLDELDDLAVDPDDLVWASEIAERVRRSRHFIDMLFKRIRVPEGFPLPAARATRHPLWRWPEVESWITDNEGGGVKTDRADVLQQINGLLKVRIGFRYTDHAEACRQAMAALLT